jgi:hypothetical protein
MWDRVKQIAENHPWAVGAAVLFGAIVVYVWFSSGSSSSSSSAGIYAYSADPNLIAAQTAQATAQDQTNASVDIATTQANAATTLDQQDDQSAVALGTVQASTALSALESNNQTQLSIAGLMAGVENNQISAAEATTLSTNQSAVEVNAQNVAGSITLGGIYSNMQEALANLAYQGFVKSGYNSNTAGGGVAFQGLTTAAAAVKSIFGGATTSTGGGTNNAASAGNSQSGPSGFPAGTGVGAS